MGGVFAVVVLLHHRHHRIFFYKIHLIKTLFSIPLWAYLGPIFTRTSFSKHIEIVPSRSVKRFIPVTRHTSLGTFLVDAKVIFSKHKKVET